MKKTLRNRLLKNVIIVLVAIVVFILILDNLILPWYVSSPETAVPNVVGMKDIEALKLLEDKGFEPAIGDTSFGLEYPAGTIFLQRPHAGDLVKEGRRIYLFVSGGEKVVFVPLLKNKSILDAKFALERIGLKLGRVERVSSSQPEDMIFDQQFEAGTPLNQGEMVGITVSAGRGGGSIVVPDLIGKSLSDAKTILADSSLAVGKINYQSSVTLLPNTVLDQYPSSGNRLNRGEAVDLFVTKPNVPVEPKSEGE